MFLHPGGFGSAVWDEQMARFGAHHRVVRYDARGHGDSPGPAPGFSHHGDLRRLLDALGIERAVLVGSSLGSRTAADFALRHPDRVDGLVLASPGLSGMVERDPFTLARRRQTAEAIAAGDHARAFECVLRMLVDGPHRTPEQVDPAVRAFFGRLLADNARKGHGGFPLGAELHAVTRVPEIRARTLVVTGALDTTDVHEIADLIAREAPHARQVVIEGAGHQVAVEQPARFDELLDEFLG
ncbi:Pimeloyl-ACP methyl ester carboxylesterase [Amycolatopsis australiensis]|uniref:Pimeloyl-ACP methyl ester carboxylesterase n=1 Tax=Amycolatopsis australiensis TaxID=546364 RepID=A0A1K1SC33_9PSEU|nr:Pimeloyl-ACP methyl ester carboxylesterase [Amycolatopsis australiensis]